MRNLICTVVLFLLIAGCNNKTSEKEITNTGKTDSTANITENPGALPAGAGNLTGEWEQSYTQFDVNGNGSIDDNEKNLGKDEVSVPVYFKFNKDGSCIYTLQMKFNGFYEIKNENGNDVLYISQEIGGKPSPDMRFKYRIVSMNNKEMILGASGGLNAVYKTI